MEEDWEEAQREWEGGERGGREGGGASRPGLIISSGQGHVTRLHRREQGRQAAQGTQGPNKSGVRGRGEWGRGRGVGHESEGGGKVAGV